MVSNSVQLVLLLFLVVTAVAFAVRLIRIPYWIALVIAGLIVGLSKIFPSIVLTRDLILIIFLPPLLFEGAWNLQLSSLKRNWLSISVLSTVGVAISIAVMTAILYFSACLDLASALLLSAMVSTTDPIAVLAVFRKMGINKDLTMILEGESIFNDCTSLVAFSLILSAVTTSTQGSAASIAAKFLVLCLGGIFVGFVVGIIASKVASWCKDHLLEITLTLIVAYGSFLIADEMGFSPIIAIVTAAVTLRNAPTGGSQFSEFASSLDSIWEYIAFAVNSIVFLLIGMQVQGTDLLKDGPSIMIGMLALVVSRAVVVHTLCPLLSRGRVRIPYSWRHVLVWGGLRGALPMAMALSLPQGLPMREHLIVLTLALVLFTLLGPGLTIEPLVAMLKLNREKRVAQEALQFLPDQPPEIMQATAIALDGTTPVIMLVTDPVDANPAR
jgi:monovalent cation:H+ antiporter, CPA1 family